MENKTLKIVLTAAISVSLIGNIALFWQLKEEQATNTNTYKIEEVAKNASEKLKKNSSSAQAKIDKLNQTINEKNQEIDQLKQQDGTKAKEEVTEAQSKTAEEFGKLAIDKSLSRNELTEKLKDVATQEVIDKLSPADDDHQHDDYGSYSFTLGDVQTYAQTSSVKEEQNFIVFVDYTIGNPQFKDVKPQKIKGGLTVTEKQVDGQWKVTDFSYFTR
jgi:small-conductance mechanosensitive channel